MQITPVRVNEIQLDESTADARWQWHTFQAMNTSVSTWFFGDSGNTAREVESLFRSAERRMSRFLVDSELSVLNRNPENRCALSNELYSVVEAALWAANATGGLYDPTVLADLLAAGYNRSFEQIVENASFRWVSEAHAPDVRTGWRSSHPDYRSLQLLPEQQSIERPAGLAVDLGGIGKGWTVDRAAEMLYRSGPFLVNAGGDLYAYGRPDNGQGWCVDIEHPLEPRRHIATVRLDCQAMATSSVTKRRWSKAGAVQHHLIDPRTGRPANTDAISVTIVAARTALAEIYAKAVLLLGVEAGLDFLRHTPGVEGLICTDRRKVVYTEDFAALMTAFEGID